MAKWVLVAFDSDSEADAFVEDQGDTIDAVFKKPTKFCECADSVKAGKVGQRGAKFGWFVCAVCKRPKKGGGQVVYNLLESEKAAWRKVFHLQLHPEWSKEEKA